MPDHKTASNYCLGWAFNVKSIYLNSDRAWNDKFMCQRWWSWLRNRSHVKTSLYHARSGCVFFIDTASNLLNVRCCDRSPFKLIHDYFRSSGKFLCLSQVYSVLGCFGSGSSVALSLQSPPKLWQTATVFVHKEITNQSCVFEDIPSPSGRHLQEIMELLQNVKVLNNIVVFQMTSCF